MEARLSQMLRGKPQWTKNEDHWHGIKKLGYGGQGCAGLFVKIDPKTQLIIDRVVVKETRDMASLLNNGYSTSEPLELFMSNKMLTKTNTINIFAHRVSKDKESYRLYMEYCALGDLTGKLKEPYQQRNHAFPEPYLWKLFLDLAHAAQDMDNLVGDGLPRGSFIAHVDFKPDNVFMCPPDKDNFPKYPVAKLGDFGGAMLSHPRERYLDHLHKIRKTYRTDGYVAPEVHRCSLRSGELDEIPIRQRKPGLKAPFLSRVTATTNVWNAALIVAELMFPESLKNPVGNVPPGDMFLYYHARDEWIEKLHQRKDYSIPNYSPRLKNLVMSCLDYFPDQRPTPTELVELVKAGVDEHALIMSTNACLDAKLYQNQHDLARYISLTDDFPINQPKNDEEVYDMGEDVGAPQDDWASLCPPSTSAKAGAKKPEPVSSRHSYEDEAAGDTKIIASLVAAFKDLIWKI